MKTLLAGISALALTAGSAYADSMTDTQVGVYDGYNTNVQAAWEDSAASAVAQPVMPATGVWIEGPVAPVKRTVDEPNIRDNNGKTAAPDGGAAAYTDQFGYKNELDVNQTDAGSGAIADVIQIGNKNKADVNQNTSYGSNVGDFAVITSKGDRNDARIDQDNLPKDVFGLGITNKGANQADIQQGVDDATPYGKNHQAYDNDASIEQIGSGNQAKVLQYDSPAAGGGNRTDGNNAYVLQSGQLNDATLAQDGDHNTGSIKQFGKGNAAETWQLGDHNASATVQSGKGNSAFVEQTGDGNDQSTNQSGNNNAAYTLQLGDDNTSIIDQWGYDNMASVHQHGNENDSSIMQDGTWNMANVTQHGNNNSAAFEQIGYSNAGSISQTGGDYANVQQHGYYNQAHVSQ